LPYKDVTNLKQERAKEILKDEFWEKPKLNTLEPDVSEVLFDYGVQSSPERAIKAFQNIIGTKVDGKIGDNTRKKQDEYIEKNGKKQLLQESVDQREEFIKTTPAYKNTDQKDGLMERIRKIKADFDLSSLNPFGSDAYAAETDDFSDLGTPEESDFSDLGTPEDDFSDLGTPEEELHVPEDPRDSLSFFQKVLTSKASENVFESASQSASALKTAGQAITKLPANIGIAILKAHQGAEGASVVDKGWINKTLKNAQENSNEFVKDIYKKYNDKQVIKGIPIKITDIAELPRNIAFSVASMGAGLAAGVPISFIPVPGARVAAWTTGTAASGKVAYEMSTYEIMQEYLEAKNEESIENTGKGITSEEEKELKTIFGYEAAKYGLWEAVPEALSNLAFAKILTAPLAKIAGKNIATRIVAKLSGLYGEELLTETITQKGQAGIEKEAGLREKDITWGQALKEVAPQTFLLTSVMGGAGATAISIKNKVMPSLANELKNKKITPEQEQIIRQELEEHINKVFEEAQESGFIKEEITKEKPVSEKVIEEQKSGLEEKAPEKPVEAQAQKKVEVVVTPEKVAQEAKEATGDGSLIEEAKKYKSAEEFVKSQTLVVANKGADGKIYYGEPGETHGHLSMNYAEKIRKSANLKEGEATWTEVGFAYPGKEIMSREKALEVTKVKPSTTDGELDALDYKEQEGSSVNRRNKLIDIYNKAKVDKVVEKKEIAKIPKTEQRKDISFYSGGKNMIVKVGDLENFFLKDMGIKADVKQIKEGIMVDTQTHQSTTAIQRKLSEYDIVSMQKGNEGEQRLVIGGRKTDAQDYSHLLQVEYEPKGKEISGAKAGSMAAEKTIKGGGYGTVENSEKATKERPPKTDYSLVAEGLPKQNFSVIDEALKLSAPAVRGETARLGARIIRKNISEMAHNDVVASEALKKAHSAFMWMSIDDSHAFIDKMENGENQETPELDNIAEIFRTQLDERKATVQKFGKGKLETFYENYFPHIWQDPTKAKSVISQIMGRKRLEGTKSFLKQRKIMTVKEGLERKLELVSDNPVDLVLLKLHEMDRYIMAQNVIKDLKERNLLKFVYSRSQTPEGYVRINDNAFTVFMPPEITKKEAYDTVLVDQMMDVSRSIGIDTKRFVSFGRKQALGYAQGMYGETGGEKVRTKFASPESVLAHEIGHVLGYRYKLYDLLRRTNDGEWTTYSKGAKKGQQKFVPDRNAIDWRKKIDVEWRALADARGGPQAYVRNAREKEAVMLQAMIHAPETFKKLAPTLYKSFKSFLNDNAELRPLLDLQPSLQLNASEAKIAIPGFTTLGFFVAPEQVGLMLNNYLSPGLRNSQNKLIGGGYNLLRGMGNIINQIQLSLSWFHGLNVTTDMTASTFGLGLRKLTTKGQRLSGVQDIVASPIASLPTIWEGMRLRKAYTKSLDSITDPQTKTMVEAIINAGGRDRMDTMYYNQQVKALEKTFADIMKGDTIKKLTGVAKLPFNITGSFFEVMAKPLMEWYVPSGKIGLFSKMAQHEMQRAENGEIDSDQLMERLVSTWDSVDNRMGQLIYDNLFWNKTFKDTLMLAIRSVGWNLGSWREYAGSATDLVTTKARIDRGDKFLSHKMAYTIGAITLYAILGAVIMKTLTGKSPEEPKDYFFPKTGQKNADGSDERLSLPTYAKDWFAYSTQPVKTVIHKGHPMWGILGDLTSNKTFFNVEIRHEGDNALQQAQSMIEHIGNELRPMSFKNYERFSRASDNKWKNMLTSITGISPAPSYITKSPAQKLMTRYIVENIPQGSKTKEKFEKSLYRRTLINKRRKGEPVDRREAIQMLGIQGFTKAIKEAKLDPFAASFKRLSFQKALDVYAISSDKERKVALPVLISKMERSRTKTQEDIDYFKELIKKDK